MTGYEAGQLLIEIARLKYKPNDWEQNFMRSVAKSSHPSPNMAQCLIKIYEKAAGAGSYERRQIV